MAINEKSIGPLYVACTRVTSVFWPHFVGIIEMEEPWRRGKALLVSVAPHYAMVIGIWHRSMEQDIEEDFTDDRWFSPRWISLNDVPYYESWKESSHE